MITQNLELSYTKFVNCFSEIVPIVKTEYPIKCKILEAPTGYGKSWIVIKDMILQIVEFIETKKQKTNQNSKLVIEFVAPQLKLCSQFVLEAKFYINKYVAAYYPEYVGKLCFFINNSGGNAFDCEGGWDGFNKSASGFTFNDFVEDDTLEIAIVDSCLKSNNKSTNKFKKLNLNDYTIITYIDEIQNVSLIDHPADEDDTKINMEQYSSVRTLIIGISATVPSHIFESFEKINKIKSNKENTKKYYTTTVSFKDALLRNRIVPPSFHKATADIYSEKYWDTVIEIYKNRVEQENSKENGIYVKFLFTAKNEADATYISDYLTKLGISWAKTTSASGMTYYDSSNKSNKPQIFKNSIEKNQNEEDDDYTVSDETIENLESFKSIIQNDLKHCAVIHIKQLICGIDIPFLTDADIRIANPLNFGKETIIKIQTIGRTLRILQEDRNIDFEFNDNRRKSHGHIHWIMPNTDTEKNIKIEESIWMLNDIYYGGFGDCDFKTERRKNPAGNGGDNERHPGGGGGGDELPNIKIDWTKMKFDEYVKEFVKSQIGLLFKEEVKEALGSIFEYVKAEQGINDFSQDSFLYWHVSWEDTVNSIINELKEEGYILEQ